MRQRKVEKRAVGSYCFRFSNSRRKVSCLRSSPRCASPVIRVHRRRIGSSQRFIKRANSCSSSCNLTRDIASSSLREQNNDNVENTRPFMRFDRLNVRATKNRRKKSKKVHRRL